MSAMRCNRCHRPMRGTTAYDGACECGGLIEADPAPEHESCYPDEIETIRGMLAEEREKLSVLDGYYAQTVDGKVRSAANVEGRLKCRSRIEALTTAIEALGGAL